MGLILAGDGIAGDGVGPCKMWPSNTPLQAPIGISSTPAYTIRTRPYLEVRTILPGGHHELEGIHRLLRLADTLAMLGI